MTNDGNRQATARKEIGEVAAQIAELGRMTIGELRDKFLEVYGVPTRSRNKVYLRKKIAWQICDLAFLPVAEQERILFLESVDGREPMGERGLRTAAAQYTNVPRPRGPILKS